MSDENHERRKYWYLVIFLYFKWFNFDILMCVVLPKKNLTFPLKDYRSFLFVFSIWRTNFSFLFVHWTMNLIHNALKSNHFTHPILNIFDSYLYSFIFFVGSVIEGEEVWPADPPVGFGSQRAFKIHKHVHSLQGGICRFQKVKRSAVGFGLIRCFPNLVIF